MWLRYALCGGSVLGSWVICRKHATRLPGRAHTIILAPLLLSTGLLSLQAALNLSGPQPVHWAMLITITACSLISAGICLVMPVNFPRHMLQSGLGPIHIAVVPIKRAIPRRELREGGQVSEEEDLELDFALRIYSQDPLPLATAEDQPPRALSYFMHGSDVARGYAKFITLPNLFAPLAEITLPNAQVTGSVPTELKAKEDPPSTPVTQGREGHKPIMIFSHGLGGTPDCYSSMIYRFVREGYLVAAVEHGDGSASATLTSQGLLLYQPLKALPEEQWIPRRRVQLARRSMEVVATIDYLQEQNEDVGSVLFNKLNVGQLYACGHSFGGATCAAAASVEPRIRGLVGLDIWCEPISDVLISEGLPREVPMMQLMSYHFHKWQTQYHLSKQFQKASRGSLYAYLQESRHQNFADFAFIAPRILKLLNMIGKAEPLQMMDTIENYTIDYFRSIRTPGELDSENWIEHPQKRPTCIVTEPAPA